jgi:serine protease Do
MYSRGTGRRPVFKRRGLWYNGGMRHLLPIAAILVLLPVARAADPPSLKAVEEQMQKVIDDVTPAVVAVVVSHAEYPPEPGVKRGPGRLGGYEPQNQPDNRRFGPRWPGRPQPPLDRLDLSRPENTADHLFGSGVVLDPQAGLVLVPYHLTDGATKVYVRASTGEGSYADIFAADSKSDLAVIKLLSPPAGLKAVRFADVRLADTPDGKKATVRRGSWVIAVGHPLAAGAGDGSPSASWGIVSNTNRASAPPPVQPEPTAQKPLHAYGGLIQVDARVTLGSSGTGVFDPDGRLVGLGSAVAAVYGSEASGGYAVPLDRNYRKIIDSLKAGREVEYGFLGIEPASHPDGIGVIAKSITPTCAAAAAGLYPEDVITAIDGHPLRKDGDLLLRVGAALAGTEVTLEFRRDGGQPRTAKAVLAKNNNPLPFLATVPPPSVHGLTVEYQSTKFGGAGGRMARTPPNPPPGVVIRELERGSAADKKFQDLGPSRGWWVITHVDGKPVTTPAEFHAAVKGKASVKLLLADSDDPANRQTITLP